MARPLMGNIEKLNAMGLLPRPPIERREANRSHICSSTLENQPSIGSSSFGTCFIPFQRTDRLSFNVIRHIALCSVSVKQILFKPANRVAIPI